MLAHQLQAIALSCYRDDRTLFTQLSFELSSGQLLLLEGANGSGKTSLLRIVCGLREPDSGRLQWNGKSLHDGLFFSEMAYMGHHDGHKKELTVLDNLRFTSALQRRLPTNSEAALQQVGLAGYDDMPVQRLSAGQKRRLALARILNQNAVVWILDEPFTALDFSGIVLLETLLQQHLAQGGMVVMSSHQPLSFKPVALQRLQLQ